MKRFLQAKGRLKVGEMNRTELRPPIEITWNNRKTLG